MQGVAFVAATALSILASWVVVSRIERIGTHVGATEALLGVVAALAGDAPEITSSLSALVAHRGAVAAGVSIGSNVFNIAALLGLGAVVSGGIALGRKALLREGAVAVFIAAVCLGTVQGVVTSPVALVLVLGVLAPAVWVAARRRPTSPAGVERRARGSTHEPRPVRGARTTLSTWREVLLGAGSLVVVVLASIVMEHSASSLGVTFRISGIVVGGVVLAAVTSLPNAVAALYWARRGRGAALLSTGFTSNAFNVAFGFLLPTALLGLGRTSAPETLTAAWYLGLTTLVLALAYRRSALGRWTGWIVVGLYLVFVAVLISL